MLPRRRAWHLLRLAAAAGVRAACTVVKLGAFSPQLGEFIGLDWDSSLETAERFVARFADGLGGTGLLLCVDERLHSHHDSSQEALKVSVALSTEGCTESLSERRAWHEIAGILHSIVVQLRPAAEILTYELEPHVLARASSTHVGIFLLKSPGRGIWHALVESLRIGWRRGALRGTLLHVLMHDVNDWQHAEWRNELEDAVELLGGLHWCLGERTRFGAKADHSQWENYFNKAFTMLHLSRSLGYEHLVSLDDDVFLPASALAFLAGSGPLADGAGCGLVAPLLQNGVPSAELWAETFLGEAERHQLYACFAGSSMQWMHEPWSSPALAPPDPWDGPTWYRRVALGEATDFKGVHPVRGNTTCMDMVLGAALARLGDEWRRWRPDHGLIVDHNRTFPYFCNNAFLMRTDLYAEALERDDLQRTNGADEVPMNLLLKERNLPLCFVRGSFGIHPVYNHYYDRDRIEAYVLHAVAMVDKIKWSLS